MVATTGHFSVGPLVKMGVFLRKLIDGSIKQLATIFQFYHDSFISGGNRRQPHHRPVASRWQTLSHSVVWRTLHHERGSNSRLGGDTDSCKSNMNIVII